MRSIPVGYAAFIIGGGLWLGSPQLANAKTHVVIGTQQDGAYWWQFENMKSPLAAVGNPAGRMQIKVKNGDVVRFENKIGKHGALFENAVSELKSGTWEVVPNSGKLLEVEDLEKPFDRAVARSTERKVGLVIEIKITNLKPGLKNGILFACNPHSLYGGEKREMLGVVVLDESDK
jgi:hypothetical protein